MMTYLWLTGLFAVKAVVWKQAKAWWKH